MILQNRTISQSDYRGAKKRLLFVYIFNNYFLNANYPLAKIAFVIYWCRNHSERRAYCSIGNWSRYNITPTLSASLNERYSLNSNMSSPLWGSTKNNVLVKLFINSLITNCVPRHNFDRLMFLSKTILFVLFLFISLLITLKFKMCDVNPGT